MANFDDYCDLDPTKLCDNCCKCLEKREEAYAVLPTVMADAPQEGSEEDDELPEGYGEGTTLPFEEEALEDADDEFEFGKNLPPLDIDPALLAEWEAKLADVGASEQQTPRFHGTRRKRTR